MAKNPQQSGKDTTAQEDTGNQSQVTETGTQDNTAPTGQEQGSQTGQAAGTEAGTTAEGSATGDAGNREAPAQETTQTPEPEAKQPTTAAPAVEQTKPPVAEVKAEVKPEVKAAPEAVKKEAAIKAPVDSEAITIPADIEAEVHADFQKFLDHFSANASASTKAWARNVLNTGVKYKRKRPLDTKGYLEATMFAFNTMAASVQFPDEAQMRMRFVKACFKYVDSIFDLELTGRGANQLTDHQYKQYNALANMYHYWASFDTGAEINKRFNLAKELGNVFDPSIAQRAVSIIGQ